MPLRGIERDNVANEITQEPNEERHYVSFEFYPFHEGMTFAVYKGLLSTEARRGKTFCVVKALLDGEMDISQLNGAVARAKEAQSLALKFNSIVGYDAVTFQQPCLAQVQRVSDFVGLFRCVMPHEKRLQKYETVVIENYIEGDFVVFNTSNGTVPTNHNSVPKKTGILTKKLKFSNKMKALETDGAFPIDDFGIGPNNIAQAFSHFTWHETNNLVICDLKGVVSDNSYFFSNPTIHSLDRNFGPSDRGAMAISEVFASHRCTNICRDWSQFNTAGSNTKNQINFWEQSTDQRLVSSKTNKNIRTHDNNLAV